MLFGKFVDLREDGSSPIDVKIKIDYKRLDTVFDARFYSRFVEMAAFENGRIFAEIDGVYREVRRIDFDTPDDIKLFHVLGGPVSIEPSTQLIYSISDYSGLPATVKQ